MRHALWTGFVYGGGGLLGIWAAFVLSAVLTGALRGWMMRRRVLRAKRRAVSGNPAACTLCLEPATHQTERGPRCWPHLTTARTAPINNLFTFKIERSARV